MIATKWKEDDDTGLWYVAAVCHLGPHKYEVKRVVRDLIPAEVDEPGVAKSVSVNPSPATCADAERLVVGELRAELMRRVGPRAAGVL